MDTPPHYTSSVAKEWVVQNAKMNINTEYWLKKENEALRIFNLRLREENEILENIKNNLRKENELLFKHLAVFREIHMGRSRVMANIRELIRKKCKQSSSGNTQGTQDHSE